MLSLLKRENKIFVIFFSVIATLLSLFSFLLFSDQFTQAFKQLTYLRTSSFEYAFSTDGKLQSNSYLDTKNTKLFYLEDDLKTRLQVDGLMQLDVVYDDATLINSRHLLNTTNLILGELEAFITLDISKTYNLKIGHAIYSKNNIDQQIYGYTIKGILYDIYSSTSYNYAKSRGLVVFGYSEALAQNSNLEYLNYASSDPSAIILENEVNLIKLYSRDDLMTYPFQQTIGFIFLQSLFTIFFSAVSFFLLLRDSESHIKRLRNIGAGNILTKTISIKAAVYLLSSLITLLIFSGGLSLINKNTIETIVLLTVQITILLVVLCASLFMRYPKQGEMS